MAVQQKRKNQRLLDRAGTSAPPVPPPADCADYAAGSPETWQRERGTQNRVNPQTANYKTRISREARWYTDSEGWLSSDRLTCWPLAQHRKHVPNPLLSSSLPGLWPRPSSPSDGPVRANMSTAWLYISAEPQRTRGKQCRCPSPLAFRGSTPRPFSRSREMSRWPCGPPPETGRQMGRVTG